MGNSICLCMIVKNESKVILRCLNSIKSLLSYWVIVDTGSTDGTQQIIRDFMKDIPGELHERPWVNFAHNRSEALVLARGKADYVWIIDADEEIIMEPGFVFPKLDVDAYLMKTLYGAISYYRKQIVSNRLEWRFEGILHEYITTDSPETVAVIESGIYNIPRHDGHRSSDPHKYRKDALLLERAILDEPENSRYVFYLAQSYRDSGDADNAIRWYKRRVDMGGWREEVWSSLFNIARIKDKFGGQWPDVAKSYLDSFEFGPHRAEPMFYLSMGCRKNARYQEAYVWAKHGLQLPFPQQDILFVERVIYDYGMLDEFASAAFQANRYQDSHAACQRLLNDRKIPPQQVERVLRNMEAAANAMNAAASAAANVKAGE